MEAVQPLKLEFKANHDVLCCPTCGHPLWVKGVFEKSLHLWCPKCRKRGFSKVALRNPELFKEDE
jgi:tRNA(Ile2) C34 agmatinyltransferase TiaS